MTNRPKHIDSNEPASKADFEEFRESVQRDMVNLERWLQDEINATEQRLRKEFDMPRDTASRADQIEQLEDDVDELDDDLKDLKVDVDDLKERIEALED